MPGEKHNPDTGLPRIRGSEHAISRQPEVNPTRSFEREKLMLWLVGNPTPTWGRHFFVREHVQYFYRAFVCSYSEVTDDPLRN